MKYSAYSLAKSLGVAPVTIYEWVKKGLPYESETVGLRDVMYFDLKKVNEWIRENKRRVGN